MSRLNIPHSAFRTLHSKRSTIREYAPNQTPLGSPYKARLNTSQFSNKTVTQ